MNHTDPFSTKESLWQKKKTHLGLLLFLRLYNFFTLYLKSWSCIPKSCSSDFQLNSLYYTWKASLVQNLPWLCDHNGLMVFGIRKSDWGISCWAFPVSQCPLFSLGKSVFIWPLKSLQSEFCFLTHFFTSLTLIFDIPDLWTLSSYKSNACASYLQQITGKTLNRFQ